MRVRLLGVSALALALAGCANWGFDSNVSPEGIKDYYKGSDVRIYQKEDLADVNYVVLSSVEGEACQIKTTDAAPKEAEARADIRRRAADLGANGLLLDRCIRFEDMPGCIEQVLCSGQAIKVAN